MARVAVTRQSGSTPSTVSVNSVSIEEVARVAFELFERRGGIHGYDQQDWFEAEQIVRRRQTRREGR